MSTSPRSNGHDTILVSAAAIGLTAVNIPPEANAADIHTSAAIRIWLDGTAPTAAEGMPISAGETLQLQSRSEIESFRAITVAADATLSVIYYDAYIQ